MFFIYVGSSLYSTVTESEGGKAQAIKEAVSLRDDEGYTDVVVEGEGPDNCVWHSNMAAPLTQMQSQELDQMMDWSMEPGRCEDDEVEDEPCSECGVPTASDEGICYQCQCGLHAVGAFDMDGKGWPVPA